MLAADALAADALVLSDGLALGGGQLPQLGVEILQRLALSTLIKA